MRRRRMTSDCLFMQNEERSPSPRFTHQLLAFLNIDDRTALVLAASLARTMRHAESAAVGALNDAGGRELPGGRTSLITSLTRYLSFRDCHVDTSC